MRPTALCSRGGHMASRAVDSRAVTHWKVMGGVCTNSADPGPQVVGTDACTRCPPSCACPLPPRATQDGPSFPSPPPRSGDPQWLPRGGGGLAVFLTL